MLGFHRREVRRWEWDTDMPKPGRLPQTSHTLATGILLSIDRGTRPAWTAGNRDRVPSGRFAGQTGAQHTLIASDQCHRRAARVRRRGSALHVPRRGRRAAVVRRGAGGAAAAGREIDDLNVFPVPDGDTGTNLLLTLARRPTHWRPSPDRRRRAAVTRSVARCGAWPGARCSGARGNSGVIVRQLLRGIADALAAQPDGARPASWPARSAAPPSACTRRSPSRSRAPSSRWPARRGRGGDARPPATTWLAVAAAAARGAAGARPHPASSCRCWPRPAWSTPAGAGWCVLLDALPR